MLGEPRSLDPAALGNAYAINAAVGNALYGTLMTDDDSGKIQFSMAESFTTADNGATFELKLRPDLVFSDGAPLNAAAVKFNWDRLKNPANGATSLAQASVAASTEVVDDLTLKVTMVTPMPRYAGSVITSSMNWIASPAVLEKGTEAFDKAPIGAGPFTLKSWTRQASIELAKNPRYWDAPKPYLDTLTLRTLADTNQRFNTVLSGTADAAAESSWQNFSKAEEQGLALGRQNVNGGLFLTMNSRRAPFDDPRARRAIAAALDLDALNLAVYNGLGKPVETLFTEGSPFYSNIPLRKVDKAAAQRLFDELAAAGKPVSFTFSAFPSTENRAMAENVQAQLSTFDNVKVNIEPLDQSRLGELYSKRDFDMVTLSSFFYDPDPVLSTVFDGSSPSNLSGINDPELNEALQAGRTATSDEERGKAYETVQRRLADQVPVVFITRVALGAIGGQNVGGIRLYGNGSLLPEELWISK